MKSKLIFLGKLGQDLVIARKPLTSGIFFGGDFIIFGPKVMGDIEF
jgi:hypothetical protein